MKDKAITPRKGEKFKHPRFLKIEVEACLWGAPETNEYKATFTYQDCTCSVSVGEGETEKELGEITCGIGAHVIMRDNESKYNYCIRPDDLWHAFQKALTEQQVY